MAFINLNFKKRRIRFDLISIQLLGVMITALTIIYTLNSGVRNGVRGISETISRQIGQGVVQEIGGLIKQTELMGLAIQATVIEQEDFINDNDRITNFLLKTLKIAPLIGKIQLISTTGNSISATNLSFYKSETDTHTDYHTIKGEKYLIEGIDNLKNASDNSYRYFDSNLDLIHSDTSQKKKIDFRETPLYQKVYQWPRSYWEFQTRTIKHEGALDFILPLWDSKREFMGALVLSLILEQISNYIDYQQVAIYGESFVLNEQGNFVFPLLSNISPFNQNLLENAYKHLQDTKETDFILKQAEKKFLFSFFKLPLSPETQWYITIMIPFEDFFQKIIKSQTIASLIALSLFFIFALLTSFLSRHISVPITKLSNQIEKIKKFDFSEEPPLNSNIVEIDSLNRSIASMRSAIQAFGLYVPKDIVKALIQQGDEIGIGGKKGHLTLFFSDIANFTNATEPLQVEQVFSFLSEYFDTLSKKILELDGTIDKYIGDSIMAFWGAPRFVEDGQAKACLAALRIQKLCNTPENLNRPLPWKTRIGIHSGEVIVGNIGTPERMNYTAIGDIVNACSRLEGINKEYQTSIIISQTVHDAVGSQFLTRPIDYVAVKGKRNKILLYELVAAFNLDPDLAPTKNQTKLCRSFTEAYFLLADGKNKEAKELFLEIKREFPNDKPTAIYLERLSNMELGV